MTALDEMCLWNENSMRAVIRGTKTLAMISEAMGTK
jgi:hypothetical protein